MAENLITVDTEQFTSNLNKWKQRLQVCAKDLPMKGWAPLVSHWTVTGRDTRKEDREAYAAIWSAYSGLESNPRAIPNP